MDTYIFAIEQKKSLHSYLQTIHVRLSLKIRLVYWAGSGLWVRLSFRVRLGRRVRFRLRTCPDDQTCLFGSSVQVVRLDL